MILPLLPQARVALFKSLKSINLIFPMSRQFADLAEKTVRLEEKGNAGVIILSRPKALNAINRDMVQQIYSIMKPLESTKALVIIKGAGEKSFCAGGDVRAVTEGSLEDGKSFFRDEYRLNALIGSFKKPYVAIIDGITMGGGVGLSVHGRYRVATERTMFAMPETAIGLFPDVGGGHFLPRMTGKLGLYLGLTGFRLKGRDVQKAGVATHFVESSKLEALENELSKCKSEYDVDKALYTFSSLAKDTQEFVLAQHMEKIDRCFGGATVEEIFRNLKQDGSEWALNTIKTMSKMSPTSLKVTHKQLELGKSLSLQECLQMEFRLAGNHCIKSDFKEGVRALLVDRDQSPKWQPAKLEDVSDELVESFFKPLPGNDELTFPDLQAKL